MTPQDLKNSILQLAIQGKLVPQIESEGNAEDLYREIQKEKQKLIAEKKIKKEKPLEPIKEEDIPFDIPSSWKWCYVGELFSHNTGKAMNSSAKNVEKEGSVRKFITTSNLYWNSFDFSVVKEMFFSNDELDRCSITKGDILMNEGGAYYGRTAIWNYDYDICFQNHIHRLRPFIKVDNLFFYYVFYLYRNLNMMKSKGTAMPGLSSEVLHSMIVPLPPLEEQKRIVAKVEELLPLVEKYGKAYERLEEFNKKFPGDMKKSVLQMAIQGKLVEQRPEEGTAEELYELIQTEKARLIKEGKIKKEKPLTVITDEEKPFDIPDSWKWCKLGDISSYAQRKEKVSASDIQPMCWTLDLEDIEKESGRILTRKTIGERLVIGDKVAFKKGNILYSKLRPYLKKILVVDADGICSSEIVPFDTYGSVDNEYIAYVLRSPYVDNLVNSVSYGVKMPRVGTETMTELLIPLPPLEEQKRIVAKLEEVLPLCDALIK